MDFSTDIPQVTCCLTPKSRNSGRLPSILRPAWRLLSGRCQGSGKIIHETAVFCPGGCVFRRNGQTCPAAFAQFESGSRSCASRWRSQVADGGEDRAQHRASDGHLSQSECDGGIRIETRQVDSTARKLPIMFDQHNLSGEAGAVSARSANALSIASRIEASFHKQGLMDTLGARITRMELGCVEITAPLTPVTQ